MIPTLDISEADTREARSDFFAHKPDIDDPSRCGNNEIPGARSAKRKKKYTTSASLPEPNLELYLILPPRASRLSQNILYYLREPPGERPHS